MNATIHTCPIQVEANLSSICVFTSPMGAPNTFFNGNYVLFALNLLSLLGLIFGLIIPNYCIKGRLAYPNNLLYVIYCQMAVHHAFIFVSLLTAGFEPWSSMTMRTDASGHAQMIGTIDYNNFGEVTCTISAFIAYFCVGSIGTNCLCLATSLYASIVQGEKMKVLAKNRSKMHLIYGVVGAFVPAVLTIGFGKQGVYTVYCFSVFPLWTRLFFYLGLVGHGVVTICFMLPVIKVLLSQSKQVDAVTKSSTGGSQKNAVRSATNKMAIFAMVFAVAISASTFKRIFHSLQYSSYYETPDAGKIGLSAYILMIPGLLFFIVFGTHRRNTDLYLKMMGVKTLPSASRRLSAQSSASSVST